MLPTITQDIPTIHQFGEFWVYNPKTKSYQISRLLVDNIVRNLGFRLYQGEIYRAVGITLIKSNERDVRDVIKQYIDKDIEDYDKIYNSIESFMQRNGKYTIAGIPVIQREQLLNDTPTSCYKFFTNGYLQITPNEIFHKPYSEFPADKYIIASKIQPREYRINPDGKYLEFLRHATAWERHSSNIMFV